MGGKQRQNKRVCWISNLEYYVLFHRLYMEDLTFIPREVYMGMVSELRFEMLGRDGERGVAGICEDLMINKYNRASLRLQKC